MSVPVYVPRQGAHGLRQGEGGAGKHRARDDLSPDVEPRQPRVQREPGGLLQREHLHLLDRHPEGAEPVLRQLEGVGRPVQLLAKHAGTEVQRIAKTAGRVQLPLSLYLPRLQDLVITNYRLHTLQ